MWWVQGKAEWSQKWVHVVDGEHAQASRGKQGGRKGLECGAVGGRPVGAASKYPAMYF